MSTVRRLMAIGAVLALVAVVTRSSLQGDSASKIPAKKALPERATPDEAEKILGSFAVNKFTKDGVLTYTTKEGATLFALQVQPKLDPISVKPRDYLVLIDTTASQAGPPYQIEMHLLYQLARSLEAKDRVAIWNVNTKPIDLTGDRV